MRSTVPTREAGRQQVPGNREQEGKMAHSTKMNGCESHKQEHARADNDQRWRNDGAAANAEFAEQPQINGRYYDPAQRFPPMTAQEPRCTLYPDRRRSEE